MEEGTIHGIDFFVNKLINALNNGNIDYVLIGGIAAVYYGRPRSTQDCDVIISLKEAEVKNFCESLRNEGFDLDESGVAIAFKEKGHFNAYYSGQYGFRADFSWRKGTLAEHTFHKARKQEIFGVTAVISSPEDIIIAKLVYGSPQDVDDAKAVLLRQRGQLDMAYISKRAEQEGVKKQLEQLFESTK